MVAGRIRHTVAFTLAHRRGSAEERDFLQAAESLAAIPGVEAFELLDEVSPKNGYRFGLLMDSKIELRMSCTTSTPTTSASSRSAGCQR